MDNPNHKGNVAELAIAAEAARLGLSVLSPLTEHEPYDLVIGVTGRLLRVQCKWANRRGDVIPVNLTRSRRGPGGFVRRTYTAEEIDAVGVYCADIGSCFLIPAREVVGRHAFQLRLRPPRNGQRAALHFADEYRLGAVAQLEERRHGMAEVRGSSPLSSTVRRELPAAVEEVGAHVFRNRFGHYMEMAAAGTEILVRRRGKAHVRLLPALK
jgi:hypothetical protein